MALRLLHPLALHSRWSHLTPTQLDCQPEHPPLCPWLLLLLLLLRLLLLLLSLLQSLLPLLLLWPHHTHTPGASLHPDHPQRPLPAV
jgi:hypothetical protein